MDSANVFRLAALNASPLNQRNHIQGEEKEADFLSLRLLNKRGRVRLSPKPIDYSLLPGNASLLAVGNKKGYVAAAVCTEGGNHILVSTLSELRTAFESGQPDPDPFIPFASQKSLMRITGTPTILKFAFNDQRLIVGFLEGPILVYNAGDFFASTQLDPIHTFPGDASVVPRDILPNPGECPELVAIIREVLGQDPGHQVDIVDVQQLRHVTGWRKGSDPNTVPVSVSWSPKGKQIAIGLQSGDMLLYNPLSPGTPKSQLSRPTNIPLDMASLLAITWLANPTFHVVFSSPEACSSKFDATMSSSLTKTHVISTYESKSQSATDVELLDPSPPFGAQFSPGPYSIILRNWFPTKFIIICGDGPSSDIGVLGSLCSSPDGGENAWVNFVLEETSTPSLPLGEDTQDLALLGLEIDLTSSKSVRTPELSDDTPDLPPSPILYAYMSDGTIVAWHVLNTKGGGYPGMIDMISSSDGPNVSNPSTTQPSEMPSPHVLPPVPSAPKSPVYTTVVPGPMAQSHTAFKQVSPSPHTTTVAPGQGFGAFGSVGTASKFGSTGFGFASGSASLPFSKSAAPAVNPLSLGGGAPMGDSPASSSIGSAGFGQVTTMPTFGAPSFGSKPSAPAFGQSGFSAFASSPPKSAFGSSSEGFAAFANKGISAFSAAVSPLESTSARASPTGQGTLEPASVPRSVFGGLGQPNVTPRSAFGIGGAGPSRSPGQHQETALSKPAFGSFSAKAGTPAFGQVGFGGATASTSQSGAFGGFGALGDSLKPSPPPVPARFGSPPGSPPSPGESPPGSPELRPSSHPTNPASSYVKPAEGFGAFVKPTGVFAAHGDTSKFGASFIKQAEGSGSSSQQKPAISTFDQSKVAVPTFGSAGLGSAAPAIGTTTPTFGSTSALGRSKPVFGTSTFGATPQVTVGESSKPITGGFSAFSSNSVGFASFVHAGKSATFGDILHSGDQDKAEPSKTSLAFGSTSTASVSALDLPSEPGVSSTPFARKATNLPLAYSLKADSDEMGDAAKGAFPGDALTSQGTPSPNIFGNDSSFSFLSTSEAESQDRPSSTLQTPTASPKKALSEQVLDQFEDEGNDPEDVEETASEPSSLTDDEITDSSSVSKGAEEQSRSPTPSLPEEEVKKAEGVPLPRTPTPRSTPTPTPSPKLPIVDASTLLPKPPPSTSTLNKASTSTTPPGSPETIVVSVSAPLAPKPVFPPSAIVPFALGLGRPSSRPIRSSPLASAPITSTDEEDLVLDTAPLKPAPTIDNMKTPEPHPPFGQSSSPFQSPSIQPSARTGNDPPNSTNRRSNTPPLLNTSSTAGMSSTVNSPLVLGQFYAPPKVLGAQVSPLVTTPAMCPPLLLPSQEETVEELPQHPMQIEFQRAYQGMTVELVQLHKKDQEMALIRPAISEPRGLETLVANNRDFVPGKYSLGDLNAFAAMISMLRNKVIPILGQGDTNKSLLQDLQNLALISETKQEELSRWVRARKDPEFARTLRSRTLGPEHSENQTRLRKALQIAHDRLHQCEDEIESLKKRLEQHKSGKMGLRPPSLDTIDRTCRNIQIALDERTKLLQKLDDRIDALSLHTPQRQQPSQVQIRTSHSSPRTPPFASVAAAALNSERSALRLKTALLSARKRPLLTTNIVKHETRNTAPLRAQVPQQAQRPEWKLPQVPPLNASASSVNRRAARTGKRHGAVPLKAIPKSSHANPVAFDWGPLPGVTPMDKLSMDVRSQSARTTKQELEDDSE